MGQSAPEGGILGCTAKTQGAMLHQKNEKKQNFEKYFRKCTKCAFLTPKYPIFAPFYPQKPPFLHNFGTPYPPGGTPPFWGVPRPPRAAPPRPPRHPAPPGTTSEPTVRIRFSSKIIYLYFIINDCNTYFLYVIAFA